MAFLPRVIQSPSNRRLLVILGVLSLTLVVTLINYYYIISNPVVDEDPSSSLSPGELSVTSAESWKLIPSTNQGIESRIKEMMRIRSSVGEELRSLESRRTKLNNELISLSVRRETLKSDLARMEVEVERTRSLLESLELSRRDFSLIKEKPLYWRPLPPSKTVWKTGDSQPNPGNKTIAGSLSFSMNNCFDYSRCPLSSPFSIYLYDNDDRRDSNSSAIISAIKSVIRTTKDPYSACIFVFVVPNHVDSSFLKSLKYWNEGRNHLLINQYTHDLFSDLKTESAILVQSTFKLFRRDFDMVAFFDGQKLPSGELSPACPARRKYLASGTFFVSGNKDAIGILRKLERVVGEEGFKFSFQESKNNPKPNTQLLKESTFYVILITSNSDTESSFSISHQLVTSLKTGAIPVILGGNFIRLPYDEVIDWRKAAILLPIERTTELYLVLKSFSDPDILEMKRWGMMFYERYLKDLSANIQTIMAIIRTKRLQLPAEAVQDPKAISLYNDTHPMKTFEINNLDPEAESTEIDEVLGPVEPPYASPTFIRNISIVLTSGYELWNSAAFDPFNSYPHTPFDPVMPSEAKFVGSEYGFRPIAAGEGGTGKEFSQSLGGNYPREQFTVVMLTYEREAVLLDSIGRLKGVPFLNKVIIVWNNPTKRPEDGLVWPNIGVPVVVLLMEKNSLNNRFLPLEEIETEAILSMDDDAHLRPDEIVFGFRVWRENRERIVGFPGRFHAWDSKNGGWLYNSNYSCELTMVLTGAAFFHKYYAYLYTNSMPQVVRDIVDDYVNCEDIAMNFLVSSITRKPPIKVTSRWTFSCPGCPVSLSESDSHFEERHRCVNLFTEVWGWNPLLSTQFRADSVLFKTRIPRDKQKCFRHV